MVYDTRNKNKMRFSRNASNDAEVTKMIENTTGERGIELKNTGGCAWSARTEIPTCFSSSKKIKN